MNPIHPVRTHHPFGDPAATHYHPDAAAVDELRRRAAAAGTYPPPVGPPDPRPAAVTAAGEISPDSGWTYAAVALYAAVMLLAAALALAL